MRAGGKERNVIDSSEEGEKVLGRGRERRSGVLVGEGLMNSGKGRRSW